MNEVIKDKKWDTRLYEDKHSFVFKYGEDLVRLLDPGQGERILDLGCGTGYLTNLISESGAVAVGMDKSAEMINKARAEFPHIDFRIQSATEFQFAEKFDAIFSNAALHWILEKEKAIDCMYENLKPGGRLVLEMGGKGNVDHIVNAIKNTLAKFEYQDRANCNLWYFPSLAEYASLLETKGFSVRSAALYDRETELSDAKDGIKDWIKMFGSSLLEQIEAGVADKMLSEIQDSLLSTNHKKNKWFADYKRLRVVAIK